jgi:hypothetical protein
MKSFFTAILLISLLGLCAACGGGGGGQNLNLPRPVPTATATAAAANVQPIAVNPGPTNNYVNGLFTSVTVCAPGTGTCQNVNGILVDTGSYGLRILGSALSISLPPQNAAGGSVAECAIFADGFTWGPVAMADVQLAGEAAHNVPLQVVGEPGFTPPPSGCTSSGVPERDTVASVGANGILGIGAFIQDCGPACTSPGLSNPGFYYSCAGSTCTVTDESLAAQVQNPVAFFSTDNNGVLISLPAIGPGGAPTVTGSLIFGIGTQSNNGLGGANIFTINAMGNFTTNFRGTSFPDSFIDSGSNGIFFLSSSDTGIPACSDNPDFYCPGSAQSLSATNMGANGQSGSVNFVIANADNLFSSSNIAFNDLGGDAPGRFDWGLPFFFGRNVYVAFDGQSTPGGPGPYWAY